MVTRLAVGIQPPGSSTMADMEVIAALMKEQTGTIWEPVPEASVPRKLEWLHHGRLDLVSEASSTPVHFNGATPEDIARERGPFQLRVVASAHSGAFGYMVRCDSPIKTIYDIGPQTRVAMSGSSRDREVAALLAWLQLNEGPVTEDPSMTRWKVKIVRFDGWEASLRAVPEGKADVAGVTPHNPTIKDAAGRTPGIRFLDLPVKTDPEGAARFRRAFPFSWLAPAPEHGVREIWGVTTTISYGCLWCRGDLDDDTAYWLTAWFADNYDLLKDKGNKLKTYRLDVFRQMLDSAMAPVHPGTVRYLKEKGLWKPADDLRQRYNLKLMSWYCDLWAQAIAATDRKGVKVEPGNAAWVDMWAASKKNASIPAITQLTDDEIVAGLRRLETLGR